MQKKPEDGVSIVYVTLQKEEVGVICCDLKQIMCKSLCLSSGKQKRARFPGTGICRLIMVLAAVAVLGVSGCSKKQSEGDKLQVTSSVDTNATPADATPTSVASTASMGQPAAPGAAVAGPVDLSEVQRSIVRWIVANHRRPGSFEEFAVTADVKVPPPPPGKKYFLPHDLHVKLVDR